jgi:hypothetical protein
MNDIFNLAKLIHQNKDLSKRFNAIGKFTLALAALVRTYLLGVSLPG